MTIRKAELKDLEALTRIYNYEVINGTSTFDLYPRTLEERKVWFSEHNVGNHPLFVSEEDGEITGYVSLSKYREKEAYSATVELSIYIDPDHRGKGVATALMRFILDYARKDDTIHNVVSVITSGNAVSSHLHEKFGFTFCGRIPEVGHKFGEFRHIDNYCLILREE